MGENAAHFWSVFHSARDGREWGIRVLGRWILRDFLARQLQFQEEGRMSKSSVAVHSAEQLSLAFVEKYVRSQYGLPEGTDLFWTLRVVLCRMVGVQDDDASDSELASEVFALTKDPYGLLRSDWHPFRFFAAPVPLRQFCDWYHLDYERVVIENVVAEVRDSHARLIEQLRSARRMITVKGVTSD